LPERTLNLLLYVALAVVLIFVIVKIAEAL
jgi:hypothetical protein